MVMTIIGIIFIILNLMCFAAMRDEAGWTKYFNLGTALFLFILLII